VRKAPFAAMQQKVNFYGVSNSEEFIIKANSYTLANLYKDNHSQGIEGY